MFREVLGDVTFWTRTKAMSRGDWLRLLGLTLIPCLFMFRRLLHTGYQYVGNDSDLTGIWLPRFRFFRKCLEQGVEPWWSPYYFFGQPNLNGPTQPYSFLCLLQRLFSSPDKGLDYSLCALGIGLALTTTVWFVRWRFTPVASMLAGLLMAGTGTVVLQLFAGHVGLYTALCLTSTVGLALSWGLQRSRIMALFPAALAVAALIASGDMQGTYIVIWLNGLVLLLRAALGSPDPVPAPTLWTVTQAQPRPGLLLAQVAGAVRAREALWTLLKLCLVCQLGALLATAYWYPSLAAGADPCLDGLQEGIFTFSASPLSCLTLLIPHLFLGPGEMYSWSSWAAWEGQPGVGACPLLLAILGIRLRFRRDLWVPGVLVLVGLLLAWGPHTPFFGLYARFDPVMGHLPVPSRMYFVTNFGLALLLAWGVDSLIEKGWSLPQTVQRWLLGFMGLLCGVWLLSYYLDGSFELWQLFVETVRSGLPSGGQDFYVLTWTRFSLVASTVGAAIYVLVRVSLRWRGGMLVLLTVIEVTRFNYAYSNFRPDRDFEPPEVAVAALEGQRISGKMLNLFAPLATGYFALKGMSEWSPNLLSVDESAGKLAQCASRMFPADQPGGLEHPSWFNRFLGVEVYLHSKSDLLDAHLSTRYQGSQAFSVEDEEWSLNRDVKCRSSVYLSRTSEQVADRWRMLEAMHKNPAKVDGLVNFVDTSTYKLVAKLTTAKGWVGKTYPTRREGDPEVVLVRQRTVDMVEIHCLLGAPAEVIVNQAWSPDWTVTVDDFEEPCLPCQLGCNRGVLVDVGQHVLRFVYKPPAVRWALHQSWVGLVLSFLFVLCSLGMSWILQMGRDRSEHSLA